MTPYDVVIKACKMLPNTASQFQLSNQPTEAVEVMVEFRLGLKSDDFGVSSLASVSHSPGRVGWSFGKATCYCKVNRSSGLNHEYLLVLTNLASGEAVAL